MTTPLVECIPNYSEARRPEIIEAIVSQIRATSDVSVLNVSSDIDHNRTVVTFIGPPLAVEEEAFRGIQEAARLIDLNQHTGSHPRIGAADVVPFVPISGVEMTECVQMAKRLGERVGTDLNIPVYLYEQAAIRPERVNLEEIRRGQYEALKAEIEPGLYRHERRFALPLFVSSVILFYAGATFAYFVVFPVIFGFFVMTTPEVVAMKTDITQYMDFSVLLFFAFGLAFEIPVATVLLVRTGLVKREVLAKNRGYVLLVIFIVAAFLTPPDPVSQTLMALPMYALYEAGMLMSRLLVPARPADTEQDPA